MTRDRLLPWEPLFDHAMQIIDSAAKANRTAIEGWTFGGGTALMLRLDHRLSKDIDIFLPDPQSLGFLTPRLNEVADAKTGRYEEQPLFLKLYFEQGEVDFIVAGHELDQPFEIATVREREIRMETAAEVIAKKLRYRADRIKARDLFDIACVLDRDPQVAALLRGHVREARRAILELITQSETNLREEFQQLDRLDTSIGFDDCVVAFKKLARKAG